MLSNGTMKPSFNDEDMINLAGAVISQAYDDIVKPWPIGASRVTINKLTRNVKRAIIFFSSEWFRVLSMGNEEYILKMYNLPDPETMIQFYE